MLLSQPVGNSFVGLSGVLLFVGVLTVVLYFIAYFFVFPGDSDLGLGKARKAWVFRVLDYRFSALVPLIAAIVALCGLSIYSSSGEAQSYKILEKEISSQALTVYGVELSSDTVSDLASVSAGVVGSETVSATVTSPFMDSIQSDRVFVFQVSNSGSAKLLESELEFSEPKAVEKEFLEFEEGPGGLLELEKEDIVD